MNIKVCQAVKGNENFGKNVVIVLIMSQCHKYKSSLSVLKYFLFHVKWFWDILLTGHSIFYILYLGLYFYAFNIYILLTPSACYLIQPLNSQGVANSASLYADWCLVCCLRR